MANPVLYVISEDELVELFQRSAPKSEKGWNEMMRIRKTVMQRKVPDDSLGFVHPTRTPDGKYTLSFFPEVWKR